MKEVVRNILGGLVILTLIGGGLYWASTWGGDPTDSLIEFQDLIHTQETCEDLWGVRRSIDEASRDDRITEDEWSILQESIADRATTLHPQMPEGMPGGLCADLIAPCLPRGAPPDVCLDDLTG